MPHRLRVTDIWKTINDPLAKVIRKKLRKTGIKHLKVVYSPEPAVGEHRAGRYQLPLSLYLPGQGHAVVHGTPHYPKQQRVGTCHSRIALWQ